MLQVSLNKGIGTRHSLFGLLQWTGVPPQSEESHPLFVQLGSVQLPRTEPLNKNPYWSPKLLSSPTSLSLFLCYPFLVPRTGGYYRSIK